MQFMSIPSPQHCLCHGEINILSEMPRAKDEVTITPLKKHFLLLFCCRYCGRNSLQWIKFSLIFTYKRTAAGFYAKRSSYFAQTESCDWEEKTFCWVLSAARSKINNEGSATRERKQCFWSAARVRQNIQNYTSMSNMLQKSKNESNMPKLLPAEVVT